MVSRKTFELISFALGSWTHMASTCDILMMDTLANCAGSVSPAASGYHLQLSDEANFLPRGASPARG
ncbi:hypothetical protein, partial [Olsenella phocaeensis]|uniref:hypothetical protein n=1 Tax=Olsenella phocaeensis TaxID=1852385 RepID=UPI001F17AC9D